MSLLENRIKEKEKIEHEIIQKVSQDVLKPTDDEQFLLAEITNKISEMFKDRIAVYGIDNKNLQSEIANQIEIEAQKLNISFEQQERIKRIATANVIGYGPIDEFINDKSVKEIVVERFDKIVIEKNNRIITTNASFINEESLQNIIQRIIQPVGKQISLYTPIVDARLPDGSRVNATIPPVSPDGATLTIRKFTEDALSGADYLRLGSMDDKMLVFLQKCVEAKCSIIVSGGTGTGKTTLLNMLSNYIPKDELIVTIEDTCELKLSSENVRRLEARDKIGTPEGMMITDTQALVKNALRMRVDRIIVGEIRDGTVVDMMAAMSTGHEGSMCTVHANNPINLINTRFSTLYSMSNSNFSDESQSNQIAEAINLIVHIKRKQGRRFISHITEVKGVNASGKIEIQDIFRYDESGTRGFYATGYVPKRIMDIFNEHDVKIDKSIFSETKE